MHKLSTSPLDAEAIAANEPAEALYFKSGGNTLFGLLHRAPAEKATGVGIVICKPFGYEATCSHRATRALAEAAASMGVHALRFDYSGTGDSSDIDPGADQIELWVKDVVAAVAELRLQTGVKDICLLGFRLGALIATLAAKQCAPSARALIVIAPVVSGRRYVQELRTTRTVAMLGADGESGARTHPVSFEANSAEFSGFSLSLKTLRTLSEIDLVNLRTAYAEDMLIIDVDGMPTAKKWADSLGDLAMRLKYELAPGLVQMLMTAPHFAQIPEQMIAVTCTQLRELTSTWLPTTEKDSNHASAEANHTLRSLALGGIPNNGADTPITEFPVRFGNNQILFGIISQPPLDDQRRRAVILLTVGADSHIGPGGLYVTLARRWARRGYVVLRLDLEGIGESGTRVGRPDDEVFPPQAIDDIRAAVDLLRDTYGTRDVSLVGVCSGAYHALRAGISGLPISRILLVNPQNYFWDEKMTVRNMQMGELLRNPAVYRNKIFALGTWTRLFSGQIDMRYIAKIYMNRFLLAFDSQICDFARLLHIHLPHDLGWQLQEITARGVQVAFIFAQAEPGIELLRIQAGRSIRRVSERCRIHLLDCGDHVFSQSGPRSILLKLLDRELFAKNPWSEPISPGQLQLKSG